MSVRDVAKICGTSTTMIQRTKKRNDGKTRVKQKIPKISSKQRSVIRTRARKLYDFLGTDEFHLVEDDETYVKADFSTLPVRQFYTLFEVEILPESETTIGLDDWNSGLSI